MNDTSYADKLIELHFKPNSKQKREFKQLILQILRAKAKACQREYYLNTHESTSYPFWMIIDPSQNFKTDEDGIYAIANMITGIWFSREAAENYMKIKAHHFSKNAKVFCHSGCYSQDWIKFSNEFTEVV